MLPGAELTTLPGGYMAGMADASAQALTAADIAPGQAPGASAPAAGGGSAVEADAAGQEDLMADVAFDGGFSIPGRM